MYSINLHQMKSYAKFIDHSITFYKNHKSIIVSKVKSLQKIRDLHIDIINSSNLTTINNRILQGTSDISEIDKIIDQSLLIKTSLKELINNLKKSKVTSTPFDFNQMIETINKIINEFLMSESLNC